MPQSRYQIEYFCFSIFFPRMNLAGMVESHFYLINDQRSKIDTSSVKFFFKKLKILTVPSTEKLRTVIQTFISG